MTAILLSVVVLSWGLSWYAIELQIGGPSALVAIAYRFALASVLIVVYLLVTRRLRLLPMKRHPELFALGFCLFSMNFFCMYLAAEFLPSGLLSVIFATAAIMGAFNQRLFFKVPLQPAVLVGAMLGMAGLALLSWCSIASANAGAASWILLLPFLGAYLFSLGNILSARLSADHDLPNIVAHGMIYGTLICFGLSAASGLPLALNYDPVFLGALAYLAAIASVLAFLTYLSLVKREGPARAAYATVLFPIVAMVVSTFLEAFEWTPLAFVGLVLALAGTMLVFRNP